MKVKLDQKIVDRYNEAIIIPGSEDKDKAGKPITGTEKKATLKSVCIDALVYPKSTINPKTGMREEVDTFEEKMKKYRLYEKFNSNIKEIELTSEEITELKKLISEIKTQIIVGQCNDMLEGGKAK